MSAENYELQNLFKSDLQTQYDFPLVLKAQRKITPSQNDPLRRNVSIKNGSPLDTNRVISKRGKVKVFFTKIPQKSVKYVRDLWNTLVNMQWRWLAFVVGIVNILAYFGCAVLFYFDSWISGDFNNTTDHLVCIEGAQNIRNFFMLGIETITTTGYGYLHPTEHCNLYFVVLTFSTIINILIDGAFISVVYAKMNRMKDKNMYGHIFSKKAVVALRNSRLCVVIRLNDREGKHWINSQVRMYLFKEMITPEGETIPNYITELEVEPHGMLFWPVDIVHKIQPNSPLWDVSAKKLMTSKLEIVVVVSGSSIKTGQSTKSQTSYLNKEIMWGYQFVSCLEYNSAKAEYVVNKSFFNFTIPQEVPLCSAKELCDFQKQFAKNRNSLDLSILNSE